MQTLKETDNISYGRYLREHFYIPNTTGLLESIRLDDGEVETGRTNSLENLTRLENNPAAISTLSLLSLIYHNNDQHCLSEAEIIALRAGGAPPARTREELDLLAKSGLLKNKLLEGISYYGVTGNGKIDLEINRVLNPALVRARLEQVYQEILVNPPRLPDEVYGLEEFRWTWDSVRDLVERILADNAYRKIDVALLGAPTVALFLAQCPELVNSVAVFDKNAMMVDHINQLQIPNITAVNYDATDPVSTSQFHRFDAVVTDPPWHVEHYALFTDRSWEWLKPLGYCYVALFSYETRPEATGEIKRLQQAFINSGFSIQMFLPEFFGYQVPKYEQRSFEKAGINVSERGKYGVLCVLRRDLGSRENSCTSAELANKLEEEIPIVVDQKPDLVNQHLTVWLQRDQMDAPIEPLTESDVIELQSEGIMEDTSRSKRRERRVNVLTEGHEGFICNKPEVLLVLIAQYLNQEISLSELEQKVEGGMIAAALGLISQLDQQQ